RTRRREDSGTRRCRRASAPSWGAWPPPGPGCPGAGAALHCPTRPGTALSLRSCFPCVYPRLSELLEQQDALDPVLYFSLGEPRPADVVQAHRRGSSLVYPRTYRIEERRTVFLRDRLVRREDRPGACQQESRRQAPWLVQDGGGVCGAAGGEHHRGLP